MKIRLQEAKLFHADRRTDMTKLIVAFRNFANASKNIRSATDLFTCCRCITRHPLISLRNTN